MEPTPFDLTSSSAPVSAEAWRARVERDLRGASFDKRLVTHLLEGIALQPLVTRHDHPTDADPAGLPGTAPFTRGSRPVGEPGWDIRQSFIHPSPAATAAEIKRDLARGVTSVHLVLDSGGRGHGIRISAPGDLGVALGDTDLAHIPVSLDAGAGGRAMARAALALGVRRGDLAIDPIGTLAATGALPGSLDDALSDGAALAASLDRPGLRIVAADTRAWHAAGASEELDIAIAASTGIAWLRSMETAGLEPDAANARLGFRLALGCDFLMGIAKLRAFRAVWGRVMEACGASTGPAHVHTFPARRVMTVRDPWVNILRVTAATFAGAVGGADAITATPWDTRLGLPDADSRRLARNTQLILALESHLGHPVDAAGGSWALESLTERLSARAWTALQALEAAGGLGTIAGIQAARERLPPLVAARERDVARRMTSIVGVNAFPNLGESVPKRVGIPPADIGAVAAGDRMEPLRAVPLSAGWEALRDSSDAHAAKTGTPPRVFLANLGPLAVHTARATWITNLLNGGGIECVDAGGFDDAASVAAAFARSGCAQACICTTDARVVSHGADTAQALRQAGARRVLLAGRPGENEAELVAAGVDAFLFLGADARAVVEDILRADGVIP
ncbi:MAG: methylmalonyl-CoA mutase family protein [Myxococcota bacterium]|nr:methylmalonyl-CoA mutase family protein [Myxococcota bacterium]